jgi:hypothetical protein
VGGGTLDRTVAAYDLLVLARIGTSRKKTATRRRWIRILRLMTASPDH